MDEEDHGLGGGSYHAATSAAGAAPAAAQGGAAGEDEALMCPTCQHPHAEEPCGVCGHISGKSKVFQLPPCLTLQHPFATHTVAVSGTADSLMFATATLIRRVVFCQEMGVDPKLEFDTAVDERSRHIVARVGDLPVGVARWRPSRVPPGASSGDTVALVDRLCVVVEYRQRGVGKHLLEAVIQDVREHAREMHLNRAVFCVPLGIQPATRLARSAQLQDSGHDAEFVPWPAVHRLMVATI